MRKSKKGQVTLFVVIAIMLVAAVATILYLRDEALEKKGFAVPSQIRAIRSHIGSCIEETGKIVLEGVSSQGGYAYPENFVIFRFWYVPYWYDGKDISPSLAEIEGSLSEAMEELLPYCVHFEQFQDVEIAEEKPKARTIIKQDYVRLTVDYPITATSKDGSVYALKEEYTANFPVRLGEIYEMTRDIVNKQEEDPDNLCMDCLADAGFENNLKIELKFYENKSLITTIIDEKSELNGLPYKFTFASKIAKVE